MSMEIGSSVWQTNNPYMPANTQKTLEAAKPKAEDSTINTEKNNKPTEGVTYEKSDGYVAKKTYDIAKKSPADRAAIVEQMKKAAEDQRQSLIDMVEKMMSNQAGKSRLANGGSDLISGTVTEEARRKAAEEISEDGYWGVKQTSQRLFDFASALAGDDVEKMKKMQEAMNKGIGQAAAKLGGLPSIGQQTQEAANQLFEDYYKSKEVDK